MLLSKVLYFVVLFSLAAIAQDSPSNRSPDEFRSVQQTTVPAPSPQNLIVQLPACSVLREQLLQRPSHIGIDENYMRDMRAYGIKRIIVEVQATRSHGQPQNLRIVRKLYFSKYDGKDSQVINSERLRQIGSSDLDQIVTRIALERAAKADFLRGIEHGSAVKEGNPAHALIELFDNASLRELWPVFLPMKSPESGLVDAAFAGDQLDVDEIIHSTKPSTQELNAALISAAASRYDNSAVIGTLLSAEADINAKGVNGTSPLMNALATPCNVTTLLAHGANLNQRDSWGNTALMIAKNSGRSESVQLLEQASK